MKIFKRVLSMLIACVMVFGTFGTVSADKSFTDMKSSHWAWSYVQTLVKDGTINGYTDGSFRPEANVTRAEFVKMIGKTDKAFETVFDDISGHWAYDYIMYSDMDVEGNKFYPNVAITRNDVINILWKRAGSQKATAPSIITNQSTNADAAAWAYSYGIMNGDDGVNLRLGDGVTRAEASALICRSRDIKSGSSKKEFSKTVNKNILKEVNEGLNILDGEYNPDRTFTNGELVGVAMQLAYDKTTPMFDGLETKYSVARPNTLAFYTACKYVLGEDKMTEAYYDATANNLDALALMSFAANFKSGIFVVDSAVDKLYDDVSSISNKNMKDYIAGAYKVGIKLDNNNNIYPTKPVTAENLALILMQFDALSGFNSVYDVNINGDSRKDVMIKKDVANYPKNSDKYMYVAADVPNVVYNSQYIDENGKVCNSTPKEFFETARNHSPIFIFCLKQVITGVKVFGADITTIYYPSMVVESEEGYVMKVKVNVNEVEDDKTFDDIFPNTISKNKPVLKSGLTFYATIATGSKISGMNIPADNAVFTSIDYIY